MTAYGYIEAALPAVRAADTAWSRGWVEAATAYLELLGNVTDQTERRVFGGETVPAGEKVVSLFEPHTDIVVKGGRRHALRPQDQPGHGAHRAGTRCGGGGRQPGGQRPTACGRPMPADAQAAHRALWSGPVGVPIFGNYVPKSASTPSACSIRGCEP